MRSMKLTLLGHTLYESTFDPDTGTLVRSVALSDENYSYSISDYLPKSGNRQKDWEDSKKAQDKWDAKYSQRRRPFSPVPETIDISISNWCNFGCTYCYQSSTAQQDHGRKTLVAEVIDSFSSAPYQIAIGGGEPTAHPDFPEILESAKQRGTVPNYTTAGHIRRQEVIDATNKLCGGVSLTFHSFKGIKYFRDTYDWWRSRLKTPLNIHLIADRDVAANLELLRNEFSESLSIILLAYYPDVGRGTLDRIMPKKVYSCEFPSQIKAALDEGHRFAFSEGLLPYFFSRPEIGVPTEHAMRAEGDFSCYVDSQGRMSSSSFSPPRDNDPTLEQTDLQTQWDNMFRWVRERPDGGNCYECPFSKRCATPNIHHYLACDFAEHNDKEYPRPKHRYF